MTHLERWPGRRGEMHLALVLCGLMLAACEPDFAGLTAFPTQIGTPAPQQTAPPIVPQSSPTDDSSATPSPTLTPTPQPIDYAPMIADIRQYVRSAGIGPDFDMSVGFVDIQTGQQADFDGQTRHIALSTFKGPLGAYYLWLGEHGKLIPKPDDRDQLALMMNESDNQATSCVFERVGGLAGFNDWLVDQGLSWDNNFVAQWENWGCPAHGQFYLMPPDLRYFKGDPALGIPAGADLHCYPKRFECKEAFAPVELAQLYARLYRGEVLNGADTQLWLSWLVKKKEYVALFGALTPAEQVRATGYVKNGFSAKNDEYPVNFQHEAGIIVTQYGAYALAVFTQGDPDWPGNEPLGKVGKIVYDYFTTMHGAVPNE